MKLIDAFSSWPQKDFVSLTQLRFLIDGNSKLGRFLNEHISRYKSGTILRPEDADLPVKVVQSNCSDAEEEIVQKARYASLLWVLRNSLSHSFKSPGFGWQLSRYNSTPYYFYDISTGNWELHIDSEVLAGIARQTISSLGDHFDKERINPYERFPWSSNWFDR